MKKQCEDTITVEGGTWYDEYFEHTDRIEVQCQREKGHKGKHRATKSAARRGKSRFDVDVELTWGG